MEKCLNPDCDKIHLAKDCEDTSDADKNRFHKEHFEKKKEVKSHAKSVKERKDEPPKGDALPNAEDGRYRVLLEDKVDSVALGDPGSDYSAVSSALFEKVLSAAPGAGTKTFNQPMHLEAAVNGTEDNPIKFTASKSATLSITIALPGSHLPVRTREVGFLTVDQDMGEVLLGRPFLKAIGFDLKTHFEKVGPLVDDKHLYELNKRASKISALSYRGLAYQSADDDPIKLPETVAAGIGRDSKDSIDKAFADIMRDAKE